VLKINNRKGIRATFKALPDLQEVHILANGDHYFNRSHAETAAGEGGEVETLQRDAEELKDAKKEEAPKDAA
jgi:hypothetical protein